MRICEAFDLFPIDPHGPNKDDDKSDGGGDGPEDPELGGHGQSV